MLVYQRVKLCFFFEVAVSFSFALGNLFVPPIFLGGIGGFMIPTLTFFFSAKFCLVKMAEGMKQPPPSR